MRKDFQKRIHDPRDKKRWVLATYRDTLYGYVLLNWRTI
jgi:hypothetical protein